MITIVPYKPTWPARFAEIGQPLRQALGDLALRIDHIGSTSVPGLAAKDRIDIQITVESLFPAIEEALRPAGYERIKRNIQDHIPPGGNPDIREWTKWFFSPLDPDQAINMHVRIQGRANQRYPLLFRDYLRAHPAIAEAYALAKQGLVAHQLDHSEAYYAVKDPICDIIIGGAEAWAATTGWQQGPSDR
ncbi:MAG: uncharacterized protein JWN14_2172 [Chthonomonadales bacterium]|nr:uncharacterized protein [Chthonomonadales bacterium]